MKSYDKPFLEYSGQLDLLRSRGLAIPDEKRAEAFLRTINYYRFTGYALPFMASREQFKDGVSFDDVIAVYLYDRKLRDSFFEALEVVELNFRALFAHEFARLYGPLGYRIEANFVDRGVFQTTLRTIDAEIARSKELCIEHFRKNYSLDQVPIWAVVEVASFGTLVRLYRNMPAESQKHIAYIYGIKWDILGSYMQHMSVLRNACAHHARLYDKRFFNFRPLKEWRSLPNAMDLRALFYQFALVYRLLSPVATACFSRKRWRSKVIRLLRAAPLSADFGIDAIMHVPHDLAHSAFWVD